MVNDNIDRIIRIKEVIKIVGVSKSSLYNYMSEGRFPRPIKINANAKSSNSAVGWRLSTINKWLENLDKS